MSPWFRRIAVESPHVDPGGGIVTVLAWKLVRVVLWGAIALFLASIVADILGEVPSRLHSEWGAIWFAGWLFWGAGLVGAVTAKIVAAVRRVRGRFPTVLVIVAPLVGLIGLVVRFFSHMPARIL